MPRPPLTSLLLTLSLLFAVFSYQPTVAQPSSPPTTDLSWVPFLSNVSSFFHTTLTAQGSNRTVEFFWKADVAANSFEFGVASRNGEGWLGLGFGVTMKGADLAVLRKVG
ncbi:hypothetical protein HK102_012547, partial [Quaeritorhiza haematococci]